MLLIRWDLADDRPEFGKSQGRKNGNFGLADSPERQYRPLPWLVEAPGAESPTGY
jgi:hypothetical protein